MPNSKDALILVNLQNDFLPQGVFGIKEGREVVAIANRLASLYSNVIAVREWHPADHVVFASNHEGAEPYTTIDHDGEELLLLPDHCIADTPGAAFAPSLKTERIKQVFDMGTDPQHDSYSGFYDVNQSRATGLGEFLQQKGSKRACILGLTGDWALKRTIETAIEEFGLETTVVADGYKGVSNDHETVVNSLKDKGAKFVQSELILVGGPGGI